ncbi:MAG: AAA family ATPase [Nitrososphaerota archaeon]|nr:AAA family ATPase [Nitrososphaerota archaeon]
MIDSIRITNYKSIEEATIETPLITLLVGPNGSGKSSAIQALGILKNFFLNSNRSLDDILNLGYLRLGNHSDVVFRHDNTRVIEFEARLSDGESHLAYTLGFGPSNKGTSKIQLLVQGSQAFEVSFTIPYAQNTFDKKPMLIRQKQGDTITERQCTLIWNGITMSVEPAELSNVPYVQTMMRTHLDSFLGIYIVPPTTAFVNSLYSVVGVPDKKTLLSIPDSTLVTMLMQDSDLEEAASSYMEATFGVRNVAPRYSTYPNISVEVGRKRFKVNVVNEGFGLNRSLFLLATLLTVPKRSTIAVEEPENHLHPRAQGELARQLVVIAQEQAKQLVITTHSEHMLLGFLSAVSKGNLKPSQIAVYFCELEPSQMRSRFARAEINELGQVKGGLKDFFEVDVEALSDIFKSLEETKLADNSG